MKCDKPESMVESTQKMFTHQPYEQLIQKTEQWLLDENLRVKMMSPENKTDWIYNEARDERYCPTCKLTEGFSKKSNKWIFIMARRRYMDWPLKESCKACEKRDA